MLWAVRPHHGPPSSPSTAGTAALAFASVAGLAVSLALARFVVRRPQPAGSPAQLEVADGLRAQAVRDALHLTAVVSVVTTLALGLEEQQAGLVATRGRNGTVVTGTDETRALDAASAYAAAARGLGLSRDRALEIVQAVLEAG